MPFAAGPRFVIRDRDAKFGADFDRVAKGAAIRLLKTAVQAPLMNATCERFLGSVRRECLDHVIILGEDHLRSVLSEYVEYFNASRPHQGIAQRVPVPNPAKSSAMSGNVVASPGARRSPPCVPVGRVTQRMTKGASTGEYHREGCR
jgi:transposase InsO family protein